jgi:hypothetical protein
VGVCLAVALDLLRRNLNLYFPQDWATVHDADCLSDWYAARLSRLGVNAYSDMGTGMMHQRYVGQAPTALFWFLPLVNLSKPLMAELMSASVLILLFPHVYLITKTLKWPAPAAVTALIASLVISSHWVLYHFQVVQLSEHIAFMYVLGWLFLRRGQDTRAGVCLGIAATLKLYPGLMLLMLLLGKRWRGFLAGAATWAIVAGTVSLVIGFDCWPLFLAQEKLVTEDWLGSLQNSSLSGLVNQVLFPVCENGQGHPSKLASMLTACGSLMLIATATWLSRNYLKRSRSTDPQSIDLAFALFAPLSVFLNPFTWEHYYVALVLPLLVIATYLWQTFRVVFRRWSDRECTTSSFVTSSLVLSACAVGLLFVLHALRRYIWWGHYFDIWKRTLLPMFHWQIHYSQALNFMPWVLLILVCATLMGTRNRLGITKTM